MPDSRAFIFHGPATHEKVAWVAVSFSARALTGRYSNFLSKIMSAQSLSPRWPRRSSDPVQTVRSNQRSRLQSEPAICLKFWAALPGAVPIF